MHKPLSAYQLASSVRREHHVPVFPVKLSLEADGKWQKQPLVKWGSISGDPDDLVWHRANAVGVPMGRRSGLLTIDLDSYKRGSEAIAWAEGHKLPATRTHHTASGGQHLIFRLPKGMDLGNRAPKVHGLDVRGNGGFIVWADTLGRYSVVDDRDPAPLPWTVSDELSRLNFGAASIVLDTEVPAREFVDDKVLLPKLKRVLADPVRNRDLVYRFNGVTAGLKDKSRSSMDMSVAALLATAGFDFHEIAAILLKQFPHGKAGRDGWTDAVERQCCRCAWRATSERERRRNNLLEAMEAKTSRLVGQLAGRLPKPHAEGPV